MNQDKKVAFYTLGCKLNFSETSTIARGFQQEGFKRVDFGEKADIYVINTCSVTDNADKRFKTIVKNAQKQNENAFVVAIGCYAQLKPEELAQADAYAEAGAEHLIVMTASPFDLDPVERFLAAR